MKVLLDLGLELDRLFFGTPCDFRWFVVLGERL
jgi:hypothetical protein